MLERLTSLDVGNPPERTLTELDWNVAIYCRNEENRIAGCLERVIAALQGRPALVTVIINGSTDRTLDIVQTAARANPMIHVYTIPAGDKSNAINQFFYNLRVPARFYGGVDGYSFIGPTSFTAMQQRLETDPHAMAASGSCTNGRTMKHATQHTLTIGGKLHGQLHGFRRSFIDRLVARGIRLPLGTYWGDGLLGSMAAHDLDAQTEPWDNTRLVGVAGATYEIPALSPFRVNDIRRHLRRKVSQMSGRVQNAAITDIIYRLGYEGLPGSADDMARTYLATHPLPKTSPQDRPFQIMAMRNLGRRSPLDPASCVPRRILTLPAAHRTHDGLDRRPEEGRIGTAELPLQSV